MYILIKFMTGVSAVAFFLVAMGCSGPVTITPTTSNDSKEMRHQVVKQYRIGVDDLVRINVWGNDELSVEMPVRPDGMISMPLIGDVRAGGHTPMEVATNIKRKLSAYVRKPNVTVILTGLNSHAFLSRIRVTGAVRTPLSIPYRQGMTVLDAVLEAGGVNDFASSNATRLYRKTSTGTSVLEVELGGILNSGELDTNYELIPGDIITVPERLF